jgi:hypothetical protein
VSRYEIAGKNPDHSVVVGYDPPLRTFFAQVSCAGADEDEDDGHMLLWVGTNPGEIATVESLARTLATFAEIPAAVADELRADLAAKISAPLGPAQRAAHAFIKRQT